MWLEESLLENKVKALVATSALGMGYDKHDLAFVIHYQSPGSVVSYYQQVGRAGRGIPKAYGVLLSGNEDDDIQRYFIQQAFPKEALVEGILETLEASEEGLSKTAILSRVNGAPKKAEAALKFLTAESPAPVMVAQQKPIKYARTPIPYQLPHEAIARLSQLKEGEWEVMQSYLHHDGCLMLFLSNQLDDPDATPCGRCSNCDPGSALSATYSHETGIAAAEFLENILIEIEPRKQVTCSDFPVYQFPRKLVEEGLLHEPGRALSRWGEAGWGEIAKAGKEAGISDAPVLLVDDAVDSRWTFTVIAALLLRAGSGPVYPFAIMSTSTNA